MIATINIKGMSCEHCVKRVTGALEKMPGVSNVSVDLASGQATLEKADGVSIDDIARVIEETGYEPQR